MKPIIKEIKGRKALKEFVLFPEELYKDDPWWVPSLISDEINTLLPEKNPAFDYCEAAYFLAYNTEGKIVGRVAAMINHKANEAWNEKSVRFGWIDFIEDQDVVDALVGAVEKWGKEKGMEKCKGPLGFTDMDKEGLLVEGFERLVPFTTIYNYPYYGPMLEAAGYSKDVDWTQRIFDLPEELPRMYKLVDALAERAECHIFVPKNKKELREEALKLFNDCYNSAFSVLYEFAPLTDKQVKAYVDQYIPVLNMDFIAIIHDRNERIVGFAVAVPSLSKAFQKSRGRLFPTGLFHILHALNHEKTVEALMIGIVPEYQKKGLQVLLFHHLHMNGLKHGIKRMIMNPQLENNIKVQMLFDDFNPKPYMRRRSYIKEIK